MIRLASSLLAATLALAGCAVSPAPPYAEQPPASIQPPPFESALPPPVAEAPLTAPLLPAHLHAAVLLPLSGRNAELGQALLKAVRLAIGAPPGGPPVSPLPAAPPPDATPPGPPPPGSPPEAGPAGTATPIPAIALDPRDTSGTPEGAAAAARQAIEAGDGLILGPLTAPETAAVARAVGPNVPVLAFTSDPVVARPDLWPLGITPAEQVRRLIAAAQAEGRTRFAALLPRNALGNALADALTVNAPAGMEPPVIRRYTTFTELSSELAALSGRPEGSVQAPPPPAPAPPGAPAAAASSPAPPPASPLAFDALLVGPTGAQVPELTQLLAFDGVRPPAARVLGPGTWASEADRLGSLAGAWYAAPDPALRSPFEEQYRAAYGSAPPKLASLAYDAAAMALVAANAATPARDVLTQPQGFAGSDGFILLLPDGRVRRGLAVFEIQPGGGARMVSPSPQSASQPGV